MTPFDPGYWYFWPVTSMTLAVVTAVHLYGRARSNDYRARTALGLAGAGVLTVSIPFAALATSVDIKCSDSAGVSFEPGLGVVAIVLASCVLFWLVVVPRAPRPARR